MSEGRGPPDTPECSAVYLKGSRLVGYLQKIGKKFVIEKGVLPLSMSDPYATLILDKKIDKQKKGESNDFHYH